MFQLLLFRVAKDLIDVQHSIIFRFDHFCPLTLRSETRARQYARLLAGCQAITLQLEEPMLDADSRLLDYGHCIVLLGVETLAELLTNLGKRVAFVQVILSSVATAFPCRIVSSDDLSDAG